MLNFALGRVYDEAGDYDAAFRSFAAANDIRKSQNFHSPDLYSALFDRLIKVFSKELFLSKKGMGSNSQRPVFVFGMMRSGTTLVEQILASHPDVHGHGELEDIRGIENAVVQLYGRGAPFPSALRRSRGNRARPSRRAFKPARARRGKREP